MSNCPIMTRIKENYEYRSKNFLTRRTPVICRIDGKAFHTYTKGLKKPYDFDLMSDMDNTAIYLCENIQGAKCAYVQSDEISILITDYDDFQTQAWFDNNVQKMTSVSASLTASKFNQLRLIRQYEDGIKMGEDPFSLINYTLANFDSRVFNIPKEEVTNYFIARQKDAVKNSISMLAQSLYPNHKDLDKKNSNERQEMCFQKGVNWNDVDPGAKRGRFIIKNTYVNGELLVECDDYTDMCEPNYYYTAGNLIKDDGKYYHIDTNEEVEVTIRTKWEVVETPDKFTLSNFKDWI